MAEGGADVDFGRDEQQKVREENNDDLEWEDEFEQNPDGQTQETSFGGGEVEQLGLEGSKKELLKQKLNAFYSDVEEKNGHRILFREQGITIASVLTAISLAISTLVSSIVAAVRGASVSVPAVTPEPPAPKPPAPKPPAPKPPDGGVKEWIKKHLENLANALKKLGLAALGALPGVIGAIVNWLLKTAGEAVGWVAEHMWALIVGVCALLYAYVQKM